MVSPNKKTPIVAPQAPSPPQIKKKKLPVMGDSAVPARDRPDTGESVILRTGAFCKVGAITSSSSVGLRVKSWHVRKL